MILKLIRFDNKPTYTMGRLFIDRSKTQECFTLEDPFRPKKIKHETRIPNGTYDVWLRYSPKFTPRLGHDVLWLRKVPGFEYVLIHPGNKTKDTDGCILVGQEAQGDSLLRSRSAYSDLYEKVSPAASKKELKIIITEEES